MSSVDDLFAQVAALPSDERAELVQRLVDTFSDFGIVDDDFVVSDEFADLILERQRQIREPGHVSRPWREVMDEIDREIDGSAP